MTVTTYTIRAASAEALHDFLVAASAGKERHYAMIADGTLLFDEARVRLPYPEFMADGADPETGAPIYAPTGFWLCAAALVDETDQALAAIAASVASEELP